MTQAARLVLFHEGKMDEVTAEFKARFNEFQVAFGGHDRRREIFMQWAKQLDLQVG